MSPQSFKTNHHDNICTGKQNLSIVCLKKNEENEEEEIIEEDLI
jgi:hypothetical protein